MKKIIAFAMFIFAFNVHAAACFKIYNHSGTNDTFNLNSTNLTVSYDKLSQLAEGKSNFIVLSQKVYTDITTWTFPQNLERKSTTVTHTYQDTVVHSEGTSSVSDVGGPLQYIGTAIPGLYVAAVLNTIAPLEHDDRSTLPKNSLVNGTITGAAGYVQTTDSIRPGIELTLAATPEFIAYLQENGKYNPGSTVSDPTYHTIQSDAVYNGATCDYPDTVFTIPSLVIPNPSTCTYNTAPAAIDFGVRTNADLPALEGGNPLSADVSIPFSCMGTTSIFTSAGSGTANMRPYPDKPYIFAPITSAQSNVNNIGLIILSPDQTGNPPAENYHVLSADGADHPEGNAVSEQTIKFEESSWYIDNRTKNIVFKVQVGKLDPNAATEFSANVFYPVIKIEYY